ncbi:hypothetical protein BCR37DRAFT_48410 [Protomyces lactucae-debilis]|uniref:SEC7 domain-containing protein n=1 Tax=Protomyces lactucae-debilis TaxID=2754530 RepID=A0A1Y2FCC8_PROLT|nr:uncharacterized protein BCR37DRAFT_48410 [Protomyces lactucae-debilis]ORY81572.1 hypothetical protein BCR37DRAFT_48410 [Protomyces lactucae-debilis]
MDNRDAAPVTSIPPVSLILNETISLVASMRKQTRWSTSSVAAILGGAIEANMDEEGSLATRWGLRGNRSTVSENPLLAGFSKLRQDLLKIEDINEYDMTALLHPFLAVIRSSAVTGSVTSLALNSVSKFFSYRIIHNRSKNLPRAMKLLSSAVTHCRFEASDSGQDEIVLLRILMLMQEMMSGIGGDLLDDESVCEMVETGLSMCCQMRLSEMLRRSAEMTMLKMVQVIFVRLKHIPVSEADSVWAPSPESQPGTPNGTSMRSPTKMQKPTVPRQSAEMAASEENKASQTSAQEADAVLVPYGIVTVRELLRVLISILDPADQRSTDSMRIMALRIIEVAFEVGGNAISERPVLRRLAVDDLCRHLFQLIRSDNHIVLQHSLRVISTLLHTMRVYLKLQQELFLNYVVACLVPRPDALKEAGIDPSVYEALPIAPKIKQLQSGRSTPVPVKERQKMGLEGGGRGADAREVMIECIGTLVRIPTFMVDLFVNYDCEQNLSDLCEDVVGFLCRNAFPDTAIWSTTNVPPLCLDALLGYISLIHSRLDLRARQVNPDLPDSTKLSQSRQRKELVLKASAKFNEKPKLGVAFLLESDLIDKDDATNSLAQFLFASSRINKEILGDYISRPDSIELLRAFVRLFDYRGKRLDEALRALLQRFRLPGESQQIARIVEEFAAVYFEVNKTVVKSADAAYVLAYAVIMLNTDQHNVQARKSRMTSVQFASNLRGTNDGENFPAEYLDAIYNDIKTNEIILAEEHDTSASFAYAWKELMEKVDTAGPLIVCETNQYDKAMFEATWRPLITTLTFVFTSATDDAVFSRLIGGLSQCASIAARYGLHDAMDQIIHALSRLTLFTSGKLPSTQRNLCVDVDGQSVTVSELGVAFGREFKAQLATVILFRICDGNERVIRDSWEALFDIFGALLINSLLPPTFSQLHRFMKISPIPLPPPPKSSRPMQRNQEASFFNSFASYLSSYASDEPPPPTSEELESTLCTYDCIKSCHLDKFADNLLSLSVQESEPLVKYLLRAAQERPKADNEPSDTATGNVDSKPVYRPKVLLCLETATALALRNDESVVAFGGLVINVLSAMLYQAAVNHSITNERILAYLLRLHQAQLTIGKVEVDGFLVQLNEMPEALITTHAVHIAYGLLECLKVPQHGDRLSRTSVFFDVLEKCHQNTNAASLLFEIARLLSAEVTSETFEPLVALLGNFADAGAVGQADERPSEVVRTASTSKRASQPAARPTKPTRVHKVEVERACKAIELVYQFRLDLPVLLESDRARSRDHLWRIMLGALQSQCLNPCREVKQAAFTYLQRTLLQLDLSGPTAPTSGVVFDELLVGLNDKLGRIPAGSLRPKVLEEGRVQASSLMCKVWLQHLSALQQRPAFDEQWLLVLKNLAQLMQSAGGTYFGEAVSESLKNVLLVMASTEILVPGSALHMRTQAELDAAGSDMLQALLKGSRPSTAASAQEQPLEAPLQPSENRAPSDEGRAHAQAV